MEQMAELLRQVTDWEYLLRLTSRHSIAPLVSYLVNQIDTSDLPQSFLTQLQPASRDRARRSLELTADKF